MLRLKQAVLLVQKEAWQVGDKVEHRKWGKGTVVQVNNSSADIELTIAFPEVGIKNLMAAFAPIEKISSDQK